MRLLARLPLGLAQHIVEELVGAHKVARLEILRLLQVGGHVAGQPAGAVPHSKAQLRHKVHDRAWKQACTIWAIVGSGGIFDTSI